MIYYVSRVSKDIGYDLIFTPLLKFIKYSFAAKFVKSRVYFCVLIILVK